MLRQSAFHSSSVCHFTYNTENPSSITNIKYGIRNAAPPNFPVRYGNIHILPIPTAEPMQAIINPILVRNSSRPLPCVFFILFSHQFKIFPQSIIHDISLSWHFNFVIIKNYFFNSAERSIYLTVNHVKIPERRNIRGFYHYTQHLCCFISYANIFLSWQVRLLYVFPLC